MGEGIPLGLFSESYLVLDIVMLQFFAKTLSFRKLYILSMEDTDGS